MAYIHATSTSNDALSLRHAPVKTVYTSNQSHENNASIESSDQFSAYLKDAAHQQIKLKKVLSNDPRSLYIMPTDNIGEIEAIANQLAATLAAENTLDLQSSNAFSSHIIVPHLPIETFDLVGTTPSDSFVSSHAVQKDDTDDAPITLKEGEEISDKEAIVDLSDRHTQNIANNRKRAAFEALSKIMRHEAKQNIMSISATATGHYIPQSTIQIPLSALTMHPIEHDLLDETEHFKSTLPMNALSAWQQTERSLGGDSGYDGSSDFLDNPEQNAKQIIARAEETAQKSDAIRTIISTLHSRINREFNIKNANISVQMKHQTLGSVDMDLTVDNGKARLIFKGEKKEMQRLLSQNRESIKLILIDADLEVAPDAIQILPKNANQQGV